MTIRRPWSILALLIGLGAAAGPSAAQDVIYGMTAGTSIGSDSGVGLVRFNAATPGTITTIGNFTGVTAGQGLRTIDFSPANGQLYALSSNIDVAQLYTVNLSTAALTPVGSGFSLNGNTSNTVSLGFNPVTNEIRVVTSGNQNYRVNPTTGTLIAQDTSLAYAAGDVNVGKAPAMVAVTYSNHAAGASTTTAYGWDYLNDALVRIGGPNGTPSPNGGSMSTIGMPTPPTTLTNQAAVGMSISPVTGTLYVTHDDPATGGFMSLYTRDLVTGTETLVGAYPTGPASFVADISVAPVSEPVWTLAGAGLAGLAATFRRRLVPLRRGS
jgi:hypothetical protein